jgi:two-component system KDP operon response regulator KdpE
METSQASLRQERQMPSRILVIEDDTAIASLTQLQLETRGFEVQLAENGVEGLRHAYAWQPDLVVLDIMMPDMDGWTVCERLRELSDVPIIFVTAIGKETDIVRGLEMGADDYLVKPFSPRELVARIDAVLRRGERDRGAAIESRTYENGALSVNLESRQVRLNDAHVDLTPIEFKLLSTFIRNEDKVLTHRFLLSQVWGPAYEEERQYLKLYVWYLRQKIEEDPSSPNLILTERGVGYRMVRTDSA